MDTDLILSTLFGPVTRSFFCDSLVFFISINTCKINNKFPWLKALFYIISIVIVSVSFSLVFQNAIEWIVYRHLFDQAFKLSFCILMVIFVLLNIAFWRILFKVKPLQAWTLSIVIGFLNAFVCLMELRVSICK